MRTTFDQTPLPGWSQPGRPARARRRAWWTAILLVMAFVGGAAIAIRRVQSPDASVPPPACPLATQNSVLDGIPRPSAMGDAVGERYNRLRADRLTFVAHHARVP